jgi:hypothetical protein
LMMNHRRISLRPTIKLRRIPRTYT